MGCAIACPLLHRAVIHVALYVRFSVARPYWNWEYIWASCLSCQGGDWYWKQIPAVGEALRVFSVYSSDRKVKEGSTCPEPSFWRNVQAFSVLAVKQSWKEVCLVNLTAWNKSLKIKHGRCLIVLSNCCALSKHANAVLDVDIWECISQWTLNVKQETSLVFNSYS